MRRSAESSRPVRGRSLRWDRRKQEPQACEERLGLRQGTRRAHAPCRGFLALRPARDLRAARCAGRLTEVVRLRPAHGENATRTPLIGMETGNKKTLTTGAGKSRQSSAALRLRSTLCFSCLQEAAVVSVARGAKRDMV